MAEVEDSFIHRLSPLCVLGWSIAAIGSLEGMRGRRVSFPQGSRRRGFFLEEQPAGPNQDQKSSCCLKVLYLELAPSM